MWVHPKRSSVQSLVRNPGLQTCEEGKSLALPSRVFLSVFYECGITALLVFWQPLWAQRIEQLFPRGLFLQLCCYFPFLDQGRLWALVLRQGHPFASPTVPGEEVVIAPREASLPAPDFFTPSWLCRWGSTGLSVSYPPVRAPALVQQ